MPAIVQAAALDEDVAKFHYAMIEDRRSELASLIATGVENGEISTQIDPGVVAEVLGGPIFFRRLFSTRSADDHLIDQIMELVLGV